MISRLSIALITCRESVGMLGPLYSTLRLRYFGYYFLADPVLRFDFAGAALTLGEEGAQ